MEFFDYSHHGVGLSWICPATREGLLILEVLRLLSDLFVLSSQIPGVLCRGLREPILSSRCAENKMPNLRSERKVIIWKRPILAEFIQTRAPNQLPSEGFRRISMGMRKGFVYPFLLLVYFQIGGFGILPDRRLQ